MAEKIEDGYGGNSRLKRSGDKIDYTEDQTREIIKCIHDPVYFIKNYVKIVNVDRGLVPFDLYDFQEELIKTFNDNRFNIVKYPRQSGKCLQYQALTTLRNKKTGEVFNITIGDFYERMCKERKDNLLSEK
jgi:hypothetical protein